MPKHAPPTARTLPSRPIDPIRKMALPDEKTVEQEKWRHEFSSPYEQAHSFLEACRIWYSPALHFAPGPWENYNMEKPLRIQMPMTDWIKLQNDLGETER